jgi:hypothetical protein
MPAKASGTIYWYNNKERIIGGIVKASHSNASGVLLVQIALSDDDGDYSIDLPEEGEWQFQALHPDAFSSVPFKKTFGANETLSEVNFTLKRNQGEHDRQWGLFFFIVLIVVFMVLILGYMDIHQRNPPKGQPIDETLNALVLVAQNRTAQPGDGEDQELTNLVTAILPRLRALTEHEPLSDAERQSLTDFANSIETAEANVDRAILSTQLVALAERLKGLTEPTSYFWSQDPWRILEIGWVALIAVLGSKIVEIGVYLRRQRFYVEGIYMHLAHIVVNPIFVIAAVMLISLVRLQLTLGNDSSINLDLSNPIALVVVSFLLGIQPWSVLRFIQNTSERILGRQESGGEQ